MAMATIYSSKPAFPTGETTTLGLTTREYFAAHAMAGLLTRELGTAYSRKPATLAKLAVESADALLRELYPPPSSS